MAGIRQGHLHLSTDRSPFDSGGTSHCLDFQKTSPGQPNGACSSHASFVPIRGLWARARNVQEREQMPRSPRAVADVRRRTRDPSGPFWTSRDDLRNPRRRRQAHGCRRCQVGRRLPVVEDALEKQARRRGRELAPAASEWPPSNRATSRGIERAAAALDEHADDAPDHLPEEVRSGDADRGRARRASTTAIASTSTRVDFSSGSSSVNARKSPKPTSGAAAARMRARGRAALSPTRRTAWRTPCGACAIW